MTKVRITLHPLTKDLLRYVLKMEKSQFNRYLKDTEEAIIKEFPYYNRFQKILTEEIFEWICLTDRRLKLDIVIASIIQYYPDYKIENYIAIGTCYGFYSLGNIPNLS